MIPSPPLQTSEKKRERKRENRRKGTRDGYVDDDYDYVPEKRWRREREREGGGWNWKERERGERGWIILPRWDLRGEESETFLTRCCP